MSHVCVCRCKYNAVDNTRNYSHRNVHANASATNVSMMQCDFSATNTTSVNVVQYSFSATNVTCDNVVQCNFSATSTTGVSVMQCNFSANERNRY